MQALSVSHSCGVVSSGSEFQFELQACRLRGLRRRFRRSVIDFIFFNHEHICPSSSSICSSSIVEPCFRPVKLKLVPRFISQSQKFDAPSISAHQKEGMVYHLPNSDMLRAPLEEMQKFENAGKDEINNCANHNDGKVDVKLENEPLSSEEDGKVNVQELASCLCDAKTECDVHEVMKDKLYLPPQVHSSVIRIFARNKNLDSALALVGWMNKMANESTSTTRPNTIVYNNLLLALKQSGQYGRAEEIVDDMIIQGVSPDVVTYNSLMCIYIEKGCHDEAINVLEEIRKKGIFPSLATYVTALMACDKLGDALRAVKLFVEFKIKHLAGEISDDEHDNWDSATVRLQNFVMYISHWVMMKQLEGGDEVGNEVLAILKELDDAGIQFGLRRHEQLVRACKKAEQCHLAKVLYDRTRQIYHEVTLHMCNHVIILMGKAKKWWASLKIFDELIEKGPKPNNSTIQLVKSHYKMLMINAGESGAGKWGIRLLDRMESQGIKPATKDWEAGLIACSKGSDTDLAVQMFRRMVENGVTPTVVSYVALLSALEKGGLYDEAIRVWEHMVKAGTGPCLYAYTVMASVFAGKGEFDMLHSMMKEMKSVNIEPSVVTYNAVITVCVRKWDSGLACVWFEEMKGRNIMPNRATYEILVQALAKDAKPKHAVELYLQAVKAGLLLSRKTYDAAAQSSQLYDASVDISLLGPPPCD